MTIYEKHIEALTYRISNDGFGYADEALRAAIELMRAMDRMPEHSASALHEVATFLRRNGAATHAQRVSDISTILGEVLGP